MQLELGSLDSPIGTVAFAVGPSGLLALELGSTESALGKQLARLHPEASFKSGPASRAIEASLSAYFGGSLEALERLPVAPQGTLFQKRVWKALRSIPPGSTATYGEIARSLGVPGGARAVGGANGRNPIALVVPCHRVTAAAGALGGYSAGLEKKRWLLAHEGALYASGPATSSRIASASATGLRKSA